MNTLNSNSGQGYHAGERVTDPMEAGGGGEGRGGRGVGGVGEEEEVTFF